MKELLRISPHQPVETVTVREYKVDALLKSGLYKEIGDEKTNVDKVESTTFLFTESMTEKNIKAKIEEHGIDIDYDIKRDNKRETLLKLKGLGFEVGFK